MQKMAKKELFLAFFLKKLARFCFVSRYDLNSNQNKRIKNVKRI